MSGERWQPTIDSLAAEIGFALPDRYNASRLLYDGLKDRADRFAVICGDSTWTYGELAAEASRVGNALLAHGAAPGDRVLVFLDDEPAYPATVMGALRAGLVPVFVNTLSPPDLVRFFLEDSEAPVAVVSAPFRDRFDAAAVRGTACRTVLVAGDDTGAGQQGWETVRRASSELPEAPTTGDDMALWMYSSGSTGRPKAVVHRHADLPYTAAAFGRHILAIREDDVCFSVPKIFFAYGFGNSVTYPMSVGACAVLMPGRPEPARVFAHIADYRPTLFFGLPTLYTAMLHSEAAETADLSSVRLCLSAAEILSAEIANGWRQRFGLPIIEGLGSTEMLHDYISNDERMQKHGSAGRVVPGYAVKLTDDQGSKVAAGEEGVMSVCGLSAAKQYWGRPEKTAETMRGEWIYTGDRFVRDTDGFYFYKGRADDMVKVSGQWVYPLEVELTLADHPKVHECCVQALQLPDERMTLHAWVVAADDEQAGPALAQELKDYVKSALLPHKYPRRIEFLDALPKTGTGKIDRQALKNAATNVP